MLILCRRDTSPENSGSRLHKEQYRNRHYCSEKSQDLHMYYWKPRFSLFWTEKQTNRKTCLEIFMIKFLFKFLCFCILKFYAFKICQRKQTETEYKMKGAFSDKSLDFRFLFWSVLPLRQTHFMKAFSFRRTWDTNIISLYICIYIYIYQHLYIYIYIYIYIYSKIVLYKKNYKKTSAAFYFIYSELSIILIQMICDWVWNDSKSGAVWWSVHG